MAVLKLGKDRDVLPTVNCLQHHRNFFVTFNLIIPLHLGMKPYKNIISTYRPVPLDVYPSEKSGCSYIPGRMFCFLLLKHIKDSYFCHIFLNTFKPLIAFTIFLSQQKAASLRKTGTEY